MQGSFSDEALKLYNALASQSISQEFSESYDFTRCVKPDGSTYGTTGKCLPPNVQADPKKMEKQAMEDEEHANSLMSGGRRYSRSMQRLARELREKAKKAREEAKRARGGS